MILPSILSTSHLRLKEKLEPLRGLAEVIHVDIEDGVFVPNLSFGPKIIEEIYNEFGFGMDIHYMVKDPQRFFDLFNAIPHKMVSYHIETGIDPDELDFPKGAEIGLAFNPDTKEVDPNVLSKLDFVVVMGVYPGFGGASFEESTYDSVIMFNTLRADNGYDFDIMVDGGVGKDNILRLKNCGADHFVAGSGVFRDDPRKSFLELNNISDGNV